MISDLTIDEIRVIAYVLTQARVKATNEYDVETLTKIIDKVKVH